MIIDITNLDKLASGVTADVYILDDSKVVKVFFDIMDYTLIENEFNANKLVKSYGISVPDVYGLIICDNRKGIVFQRIKNHTLENEIHGNLVNYKEYASVLAHEHVKVNSISDHQRGLSDQKKAYAMYINSRTSIDESCKNKLIERLNLLPENDKVGRSMF